MSLLLGGEVMHGQRCTPLEDLYGEPILINDNDTISLRLQVDGVRDNVIGQDFQGVCGVRLSFEHTNVSDLNITLVSPDGVEVILIGPATGVGTVPSLLPVFHDITFINGASDTPAPDADLDPTWSNENINWGNNPPYTGTYDPFSGDFTVDFQGGAVNGIWELIIIDAFTNHQGALLAFEMIFCEDRGIDCTNCQSRAGEFSVRDTAICGDEAIDVASLYTANNYDTGLYRDDFAVFRNDSLIQVSSSINEATLPNGEYFIYGINTSFSDFDSLFGVGEFYVRQQLIDTIDATGGFTCISRSEPLRLVLSNPQEVILPDEMLCDGDSVIFDNQVIRESGRYTMSVGDCDTLFVLNVMSSTITSGIDDTMYMSCTTSSVRLAPNFIDDVNYSWTSDNTTIELDSGQIEVVAPGVYNLRMDDGICPFTQEILVIDPSDTLSVDITASLDAINCRDTSTIISFVSNALAPDFNWVLNSDTISKETSFETRMPGLYELSIQDENGCTITDQVEIDDRTQKSLVSVRLDTITCENPNARLRVFVQGPPALATLWYNESGDTINRTSTATITDPGMYHVQVINQNFCDTILFAEVTNDTITPTLTVTSDFQFVTCDRTEINFTGRSEDVAIVESYWRYGSDTLNLATQAIGNQSGAYTFGAAGTNGCFSESSLLITADTTSPDLVIIGGELTCSQPSLNLSAVSSISNLNYSWSGTIDSILSDSLAVVSTTGRYEVNAINPENGCESTSFTAVREDILPPPLILAGPESVSCINPVIQIENVTFQQDQGKWISPSGDTTDALAIEVTEPGDYTFIAIGQNGCTNVGIKTVGDNRDGPMVDLPDQLDFNCTFLSETIQVAPRADVAEVRWVADGDTLIQNDISTDNVGNLISLITGTNGCEVAQIIELNYDTLPPDIDLVSDTTITCANRQIELSNRASISDRAVTIWQLPDASILQQENIEILEGGFYRLELRDTINQCSSSEVINVNVDTILPNYNLVADSLITCSQEFIDAEVTSPEIINVIWSRPGSVDFDTTSTIRIFNEGLYQVEIIGDNSCRDVLELIIESDIETPFADLPSEVFLTCSDETVLLSPANVSPNTTFSWQSGENGVTADSFLVISADDVLVTLTSTNGCDTTYSITVTSDQESPNASIEQRDTLICDGSALTLESTEIVGDGFSTIWRRSEQNLVGDVDLIEADVSGFYELIVRDDSNGCSDTASVEIVISDNPLQSIDFIKMDESCEGDDDGMVEIESVEGGVGAIELTLDGIVISADVLFEVSLGSHIIQAIDSLGCAINEEFIIEEGIAFDISIGPDQEVFRGDSVIIESSISGGIATSQSWNTANGDFDQPGSLVFLPNMDQLVTLTVTSQEGCTAVDSMIINVITDFNQIELFVPNAMSPASIEGNNRLSLSLTEDITSIDYFAIYDRWGQEILYQENIDATAPVIIWDGTYKGDIVSSGVYVYVYQITTIEDNRQKVVAGDIVILK